MKNPKRRNISKSSSRLPGESLRELREKFVDKAMGPVLVLLCLLLADLACWVTYCSGTNFTPWTLLVAFFAVFIWAVLRWRKYRPLVVNTHVGEAGERFISDIIRKSLYPNGYLSVDDIVGDNFNVDHCVVGPTGVFSVETKNCNKPERGQAKVVVSERCIRVNGAVVKRDPRNQAKAEARYISKMIEPVSAARPRAVTPRYFTLRCLRCGSTSLRAHRAKMQ